MSATHVNPGNNSAHDIDAQETREWMDALSAVIQSEGPERAHYLLEQLLEHARQSSIDMPAGIAVDAEGLVYVVDSTARRLVVYDALGLP